jgi:hypothetical protein
LKNTASAVFFASSLQIIQIKKQASPNFDLRGKTFAAIINILLITNNKEQYISIAECVLTTRQGF